MDDIGKLFEEDVETDESNEIEETDEIESENESQEDESEGAENENLQPEHEASKDQKQDDKELDPKQKAFLAKALDEANKRQKLEEELAQLKAQLAQKTQEPTPSFDEDPDGALAALERRYEEKSWQTTVNISRELAMERYDDYEDMEKVFIELQKSNPAYASELRRSTNPAKYAYETAKSHTEMEKFKDPSYVSKLREELKAEIMAELSKASGKPKASKDAASLPDLTSATAANKKAQRSPYGDDPIGEIFGLD